MQRVKDVFEMLFVIALFSLFIWIVSDIFKVNTVDVIAQETTKEKADMQSSSSYLKEPLPYVIGMPVADAKSLLLKYCPRIEIEKIYSPATEEGIVIDTDYAVGASQKSEIKLYVSKSLPPYDIFKEKAKELEYSAIKSKAEVNSKEKTPIKYAMVVQDKDTLSWTTFNGEVYNDVYSKYKVNYGDKTFIIVDKREHCGLNDIKKGTKLTFYGYLNGLYKGVDNTEIIFLDMYYADIEE